MFFTYNIESLKEIDEDMEKNERKSEVMLQENTFFWEPNFIYLMRDQERA